MSRLSMLGSGSSGPGAFNPNSVTGLVGWWDFSALGLADGTAISSVTDGSTAGHNLAQASGTQQPVCKTNIQNGLSVARFNTAGADDFLQATWTQTVGVHIFAVCINRSAANGFAILDGTAVTDGCNFRQVDATHMGIYANTAIINSNVTTPLAWHTYSLAYNGASSEIRVDGGAAATGDPGNASPGGITVGGGWNGTFGAPCDIGEVLFYNTILSSTDRASVEVYLKAKWGTP